MKPHAAIIALVLLAISLTTARAFAQTPTPEATAQPAATFHLGFEAPLTYTWEPIEGADELRISGTANVLRVNALDPLCTEPVVRDSRTVTIDAALPGDATAYTLALPVLPTEDAWLVAQDSVVLDAYDGESVVAQGQHNIVVETFCLRPTPTATPLTSDLVLPGCTIPTGYRETTTQAARDRGQRVFTGTSDAEAIYVRADSSCVSLAAIPPLPEFAPDGPLGVDDPPSVRTSLELPGTGSGAPGRDGAVFALLAGLAGLTGALSFMLVSRRR